MPVFPDLSPKSYLERLLTFAPRNIDPARGGSMLEMILPMSGIGTAIIGVTINVFEWRALIGYWRLKRRTPTNVPMDVE